MRRPNDRDEPGAAGAGPRRAAATVPRPLVIVNPSAGRGRTRRDLSHVLEALRASLGELDVAATTGPDAARGLAEAAVAARRPLVVVVGGDGTLSEVADGLLRSVRDGGGPPAGEPDDGRHTAPDPRLPALGLVATGTGADFGRTLGIAPRIEAYVAAVAAGAERLVDVGIARYTGADGRPAERHWLNVLSAGVGGFVDRYAAAAPAILGGRVAYAQAALRGIVVCRRVRLRCAHVLPDGAPAERVLDSHAVAICNGTTFGGGMRIAPMARPDDGLLEVVAFETRTRWRLVGRFLTVYAGTHVDEPGVHHFTCRSLRLEPLAAPAELPRDGLFPLDVDGEALGDVPLEVGVLARALRVRAPAAR
jgi:diacylglycerol kinase family enzyme